jgi:hypothetical protein
MCKNHGWLSLIILVVIGFYGCSKPAQQSGDYQDRNNQPTTSNTALNRAENPSSLEPPAAACHEFLEAVCSGNDEKAAQMLSTIAREKTAAMNLNVKPSASDTAQFSIGKVDYINDDGARVLTTMSDIGEDGKRYLENAVWVLRKEEQGWRIVGVAETVFPGEPPLVLNFEDPEEMEKKQQWVREEIRRRAEKENFQALETENNTENSMRR